MEAIHHYFFGLFVVIAVVWAYRRVAYGSVFGQAVNVWLPALLLSVSGMGLASGLAWLLLGPVRFRALLSFAVDRHYRSHTSGDYRFDFELLFISGVLLLFFVLLDRLGRAAERRSGRAIADAIAEAQAARRWER